MKHETRQLLKPEKNTPHLHALPTAPAREGDCHLQVLTTTRGCYHAPPPAPQVALVPQQLTHLGSYRTPDRCCAKLAGKPLPHVLSWTASPLPTPGPPPSGRRSDQVAPQTQPAMNASNSHVLSTASALRRAETGDAVAPLFQHYKRPTSREAHLDSSHMLGRCRAGLTETRHLRALSWTASP
jgi:hypothetical protein